MLIFFGCRIRGLRSGAGRCNLKHRPLGLGSGRVVPTPGRMDAPRAGSATSLVKARSW